MSNPRPEYPRPQFQRNEWLNLNGPWQFRMDPGDSGEERGWTTDEWSDASTIVVPFCPESELSGIHHEDFMPVVWYRREVRLPESWSKQRVLLHFGAVDHDATVWVDGVEVYRHRGGHTPFTCELTPNGTTDARHTIVLRARDPRHGPQARGKQSSRFAPYSCWYTRTTGIWQTVWLEPVHPDAAFLTPRITPDVAGSRFLVELPLSRNVPGHRVEAELRKGADLLAEATTDASRDFSASLTLTIPEEAVHLWQPGDPFLYDLVFRLRDADGEVIDRIDSYAGLRSIAIEGQVIRINGRAVFQRLVLDQGFWPESVMTAPSEEALIRDIELSMATGFNGARLHQKVFEPRFLYHADRLGYLVWGEFPDWGAQFQGPYQDHFGGGATYITQWLEALHRDYSHPSIIGWCPLNEQRQEGNSHIQQLDDVQRGMFLAAKAMDPTRPVLDASGWSHRIRESDVYDSHDYIGDGDFEAGFEKFCEHHARLQDGEAYTNPVLGTHPGTLPYRGQPYFVSEVGGFRWLHPGDPHAEGASAWGYGTGDDDIEGFYLRFERVLSQLLENRGMFGYCYTQLTDIPPEMNGIFTFGRETKFDLARLKKIQTRTAAIEEHEQG